jgi:hypothetical protein
LPLTVKIPGALADVPGMTAAEFDKLALTVPVPDSVPVLIVTVSLELKVPATEVVPDVWVYAALVSESVAPLEIVVVPVFVIAAVAASVPVWTLIVPELVIGSAKPTLLPLPSVTLSVPWFVNVGVVPVTAIDPVPASVSMFSFVMDADEFIVVVVEALKPKLPSLISG